tara:strand:- start:228 stop:488 length:261 start_codon:yes stop_codon:yes gene_type:complete
MKEDNLKNETSEKLESELQVIKIITGALIGVLSVLFTVSIYGLITKEDNATFISLIVVAISCSAILPLQFNSMKKIKTELELRKND